MIIIFVLASLFIIGMIAFLIYSTNKNGRNRQVCSRCGSTDLVRMDEEIISNGDKVTATRCEACGFISHDVN